MSKLLIVTQVYENYAWNEDGSLGTGENAYWKPKGGSEYVVKNIDVNRAAELAAAASFVVREDSDYYREWMVSWEVVEDEYLTEFEQSQLKYDGRIDHPAKVLELI